MNIAQVLPADGAKDVVLQAAIVITFDQEIDPATLNEMSFVVSGPGENGIVTNETMISNPPAVEGREYVQGTFSFALDSQGRTVATFRPAKVLRPNVQYDVMVSSDVKSSTGAPLDDNYSWSFVTGVLNLKQPPKQNPLPTQVGRINVEELRVTPSSTLNNDLHRIEILFPDEIDQASVDTNAIAVEIDAFLEDPDVIIPTILDKKVSVEGKKLIVELVLSTDPEDKWPAHS